MVSMSSDTPHAGNQRDAASLNIQFLIIQPPGFHYVILTY
jgi:hypothetical protein